MREELIRVATCIGLMYALTLSHCIVKSKKENRHKMAIMPLVSLIYGIVTIIFMFREFNAPVFEGNLILNYILKDKNILVNSHFYTGYVLIRIPVFAIICGIFGSALVPYKVISYFYEYDERYDKWFLKSSQVPFRDFFKVFKYASVILSGLVLGICWEFSLKDATFTSVIFPFIPQMVITEFSLFLDGQTAAEYSKNISGEDSYSRKIRNFYKMRGIYDTLFPHEILVSGTGCDDINKSNVSDLLEEMKSSDVIHEQKVAEFFKAVGSDDDYDTDDILASMKLLQGKNVIFYNPFYRDLGKYLILPILNTLLSGQYCLFVVGRNSSKEDVTKWVSEMLDEYGKIESFWRVSELKFSDPEFEIGVVGFNSLYDVNVMNANKTFLDNVGFVFLLEASLIINTGQIGLGLLADSMEHHGRKPVYCVADRITDGLVDTLSHIIRDEITEVSAPPISRNMHTFIGWKAEGDYLRQRLFDKQTKYLGNGIELASVAIKNQIPKVSWFGESKAPLKDIKWIAGQYFSSICRFMNIPVQQESMYDRIEFIPDLWSAPLTDEQFVIAEDEFTNLFATIRTFLSRGKTQTFVNVLSEDYLLRDYMRMNTQMFISNPDAIPCMVPGFAKSERNTLIKLLFLMQYRDVSESEVLKEFSLAGTSSDDAMHLLSTLLEKYMDLDNTILTIRVDRSSLSAGVIGGETLFSITPATFREIFGRSLSTAYYVCEDETTKDYLDARLFGNVTQTLMPGYLLSFDGKYYRVVNVTANNGVVLHRASDLYDGRKYYRQIRRYKFAPFEVSDIRELRTVTDVEIARIEMDIDVSTTGYLEMNSLGDLKSAKVNDLSEDPRISDYSRKYHKKNVLRIKLPGTDDKMRFTVCMLLSETFRSIYPDAWQYIAALTVIPDDTKGILNHMIYTLEGDPGDEYIYIVEDSELDLGLIESVEKNLGKYLELITDFLNWHFEKLREPLPKDPKSVNPVMPDVNFKRKKLIPALLDKIANFFGFGKKKDDAEQQNGKWTNITRYSSENVNPWEVQENAADTPENTEKAVEKPENVNSAKFTSESFSGDIYSDPSGPDIADISHSDGSDIFDETGLDEDTEFLERQFKEKGILSRKHTTYKDEAFLQFGFGHFDSRLKLDEIRKYLTARGFADNEYRKARLRDAMEDSMIDLQAETHCDFCGMPLTGVSFEQLNDGRIRCNDCSSTAINSVQEFTKLYYQCQTLMEGFFDIHFDVDIDVKLADAKKIARGWGGVYKPTSEVDERVLGFARQMFGKFDIFVENGSPRLETISTLVHEMTHIWQYTNWDEKELKKKYPKQDNRDMIYEGMAVWVSIQFLYMIGEYSYARKKEILTLNRGDVYGEGYKLFLQKYPMVKDSSMLIYSPFKLFPPLDGE